MLFKANERFTMCKMNDKDNKITFSDQHPTTQRVFLFSWRVLHAPNERANISKQDNHLARYSQRSRSFHDCEPFNLIIVEWLVPININTNWWAMNSPFNSKRYVDIRGQQREKSHRANYFCFFPFSSALSGYGSLNV